MPYGKISQRPYYEGLHFDSMLELRVYKLLLKYYSDKEIRYQRKQLLTDYPRRKSCLIDFELPEFYLEVKGNWVFESSAVWDAFITKLYWFASLNRDKPVYAVFESSRRLQTKQKYNLDNFKLLNIRELTKELTRISYEKQKASLE